MSSYVLFFSILEMIALMSNPKNINTYTPENTAIVVIEFQKTWTERGFFHRLVKKQLEQNKVVDNAVQFLDKARADGFTIIQAPLILDKSADSYKQIPFIPRLFKGFTKDTWKAEYTKGIYKKTDVEIRGRCGFDACEGSDLEQIISKLDVQNLFFIGFTTEHCVEMTMDTLFQKDYHCVLVSDCVATKTKRLQQKVEARQTTINSNNFLKNKVLD